MKKFFIKILPFTVAFLSGVFLYIITDKFVTNAGLNNMLINVASGLVSIPMVFIFYDIINQISSRNLHNSLFESVTSEINSKLTTLIDEIAIILKIQPPETTEMLDDFLELDNNEIAQKIEINQNNIQNLMEIKGELTNQIHHNTTFEVLSEKQISSILNIIKEINFLIKNIKQYHSSKNKTKEKKVISLNIEYILDNLISWIESGKKDAFHNHAKFSLKDANIKQLDNYEHI